MSTVTAVNWLNVGLMIAAAVPAFLLPFETFVFAYAFVGPLHYLTQISWLHDRRYFSSGRLDPWWLVVAAGLITLWNFRPPGGPVDWTAALVGATFIAAAGLAFLKSPRSKLLVGAGAAAVALPLALNAAGANLYLRLIPTIVHVFLFTGAFILLGSLKSRSASGLLSFAVFAGTAALLLLWRPSAAAYELSPETAERAYGMRSTHGVVAGMLGLDGGWDGAVAVMRFVAWAYAYHYLNWFSKTKVIGWHEIPRSRAVGIVLLYLASVALYLRDPRLGIDVLFFLSLLHVLLEFPLNHQSFVGIGRELRRLAVARTARRAAPDPT